MREFLEMQQQEKTINIDLRHSAGICIREPYDYALGYQKNGTGWDMPEVIFKMNHAYQSCQDCFILWI